MKSIGIFESRFYRVLEMTNTAGGSGSVFGVGAGGAPGQYGNQFPSQNDSSYAPGDARIPKFLGSKKQKKKKGPFIQRRPLPGLELKIK